MRGNGLLRALVFLMLLVIGTPGFSPGADNPDPPGSPVKLIFIHHSCGENWLVDGNGGLGIGLRDNNLFVSDTNYGWGPNGIGDRTDIGQWWDWFRGAESATILGALYSEGGRNSDYSGMTSDPGGENEIIMFKSCFPNSDLEGRPDDPAAEDGWLTVGNAKYTYNEILKYFATRPDKLFVVVTAPPLMRSSHAKNARAFNQWLVNDWLEENNYTLGNVAVFDFYNVLTGPDNHHRVVNGQEEHTYQEGQNLSYYPSGDDHPSQVGNRKATEEFVPLLNAFYNNWIAASGGALPASQGGESQSSSEGSQEEASSVPAASADEYSEGFEDGMGNWQAYMEEGGGTRLDCQVTDEAASEGSLSLRLDFDVARDGWATCGVDFAGGVDWSGAGGLAFMIQSAGMDAPLHVDLYAGEGDSRASYFYELMPQDSGAWTQVTIPWAEFRRVDWEENAGQPFEQAQRVSGIAFGMPSQGKGTLWVDDIRLMGSGEPVSVQENVPDEEPDMEEPEVEEETPQGRFRLPFCGGAAALPVGALVVTLASRRKSVNREL